MRLVDFYTWLANIALEACSGRAGEWVSEEELDEIIDKALTNEGWKEDPPEVSAEGFFEMSVTLHEAGIYIERMKFELDEPPTNLFRLCDKHGKPVHIEVVP